MPRRVNVQAGIASFLLFAASVAVLIFQDAFDGLSKILAIGVYAPFFGGALYKVFPYSSPWHISVGAFSALIMLWIPVVATTYGFALIATPAFILCAAFVHAGFVITRRYSQRAK